MRIDAEKAMPSGLRSRDIVHDLRNLFGVLASAGRLLGECADESSRARLLKAIADAALRGGELTTALLAASTGRHMAGPLDIHARIAALDPMLRAISGSARLRIERGAEPLVARVDPLDFDAALLELVANAHAAADGAPPDRGPVTIRARRAGGRIWLAIADNGRGMAPDRLDAVLRGPAAPAANGTGLRRVRAFASASNGRFHIRSRPGRGTVVAISLPVAAASPLDNGVAAMLHAAIEPQNRRRNMQKSDSQLQHDVMAELEWDPSLHHSDIGVGVTGGVVTLSGLVHSYAEKMAAEAAVRRVAGVRALAEGLKVRYPSDPKTADSEIARRIIDLLSWEAMIPQDRIQVTVEHGWVTLTGTLDWFYQKDAAAHAAGRIHGVTGVSNLIELKPSIGVDTVRDHIEAAFRRSAHLDAAAITVLVDGGKVTLGGRVRAWSERETAERAAWAAPGVTEVEDNIIVG